MDPTETASVDWFVALVRLRQLLPEPTRALGVWALIQAEDLGGTDGWEPFVAETVRARLLALGEGRLAFLCSCEEVRRLTLGEIAALDLSGDDLTVFGVEDPFLLVLHHEGQVRWYPQLDTPEPPEDPERLRVQLLYEAVSQRDAAWARLEPDLRARLAGKERMELVKELRALGLDMITALGQARLLVPYWPSSDAEGEARLRRTGRTSAS